MVRPEIQLPSNSNYIPTLNGWRAIAVLLVVAAHSYTMLQNSGTKIGAEAASLFSHAGVGVDIFFAISGFLICTLLLQQKDRSGSVDLLGFYTRRAFRILPPLLVYLGVILILTLTGILPNVELKEIASSALFFRNYAQGGSWYTGHFWSLAIEEHFYLFVPLAVSTLSWKAMLTFAVVIAVGCAGVRYVEFLSLPAMKVEFRTEARIDAIMYGTIAALLIHRFRSTIETNLTWIIASITIAIAALACYAFPEMPARRTLMAMAIPMPIVFTVLHYRGWFGRTLELPLFQWIGKLSYSLYIWQMPFLVPGVRPLESLQSFPIAFFCAIAFATASYFLIERPSIKIGLSVARRISQISGYKPSPQPS